MDIEKTDRRIGRTRSLLQNALMELVAEKGYYAVKIQDIIDRANVGRTTFYAHFESKQELFAAAHIHVMARPFSLDDVLAPEPPPTLLWQFQFALESRPLLLELAQGDDIAYFNRYMANCVAEKYEQDLRSTLPEKPDYIPFHILAHHLIQSQTAFVHWWLENALSTPPLEVARTYQRIRRAIVRDALNITA
ncbi:MAG: helix-turn-helix domain-containing protein [Chloroflexota bacterium]